LRSCELLQTYHSYTFLKGIVHSYVELLQYEHFRKELVNGQCAKFIDDQQLLHWQHYQRKRMKLLMDEAERHIQDQKDKTS
jgi:mediator of RNA polymerase II transcription subunit 31